MFGNKVAKKYLDQKYEMNGLIRMLQIKKFRDLCCHIKESLRWTAHMTGWGKTSMHTEFSRWKLLEKCPFESSKR
jgi:hypothetical protein